MKCRVRHLTQYQYTEPVMIGHNRACLTPLSRDHQKCLSHELRISPQPEYLRAHRDYFDNVVTCFTIQAPHREFAVEAISVVELGERVYPRLDDTPPWEQARVELHRANGTVWPEAYQYTFDSTYVAQSDALRDYAATVFESGKPLLRLAIELCEKINAEFQYQPNSTDLSTSPDNLLVQRQGVCQDFSHLMIGCLRAFGLAARYASGYLRTLPPAGRQQREFGADQSHAWVSLFIPGHGWANLDPTVNTLCNTEHIVVGYGRDYDDVSPLRGVYQGRGGQLIRIAVDVEDLGGT